MAIGDQISQGSFPSIGTSAANQVVTIRPSVRNGVRYYSCPYCNNREFETAFKLRRHINSDHTHKRALVLDHPKLDADYSELRLVVDDTAADFVEDNQQVDGGKRKSELMAESLLVSHKRKRQKRVILDPSDYQTSRRSHAFHDTLAEQEEDDPLICDEDEENVDEPEADMIRSTPARKDHCGVCSLEVKTMLSGQVDQLQVAGQSYRDLISTALGFEMEHDSKLVCSECENITSSIGQTRLELMLLQKKLNDCVSQLRDLYQRGRSLLEVDLEDGGLASSTVYVRIVQEFTQPQREARNLGFTIGRSYHGCIVSDDSARDDDGSQVQAVPLDDEDGNQGHKHRAQELTSLFLTQEEWASSGLTVWDGKVQVPEGLVAGLALSASGPRFLLSQGVCSDLGDHVFLCLHCDATFNRIFQLLGHIERHSPEIDPSQDNLEVMLSESSNQDVTRQAASDQGNGRLSVKLARAKMSLDQEATEQDVKGCRREFRAFMHKAQFKECENEVATLDKPFQCHECNKCFAEARELWGHQISFGTQTFDCNYGNCKEEFETLSEFAVHYSSHIGEILVIPQDGEGKKTMSIPCPVCGMVIQGLYKLQRHKMKHDAELKYKCPACPKQFVKANTMRRHIKSIHKGEKYQLNCHLCQLKVSNREALAQHLRSVHGVQAVKDEPSITHLTCLKCGLVCSTVDELRLHETGHLTLPATRPASHLASRSSGQIETISGQPGVARVKAGGQLMSAGVTRISTSLLVRSHQPAAAADPPGQPQTEGSARLSATAGRLDEVQQQHSEFSAAEGGGVGGTGDDVGNSAGHLEDGVVSRTCAGCKESLGKAVYLAHVLEIQKTGHCPGATTTSEVCPECNQVLQQDTSLSDHLSECHRSECDKFQCSECETRLISLQGCRRHYRQAHRGTPITCILCKETFSTDQVFHEHLATQHHQVLGPPQHSPGQMLHCRYCEASFSLYMEMVIHVRFNHLLETIDIGSTELEEVTMIGGHVVEFSEDGVQIVALHTIP